MASFPEPTTFAHKSSALDSNATLNQLCADLKELKTDISKLNSNSSNIFRQESNRFISKPYFSQLPGSSRQRTFANDNCALYKNLNQALVPRSSYPNKTFVCYYHSLFGSSARNCQSGCEFQIKTSSSNNSSSRTDEAFCNTVSDNVWVEDSTKVDRVLVLRGLPEKSLSQSIV